LRERVLQVLGYAHRCALVAATVAIIRRSEDRHEAAVVVPLVALHHELMSASDECHPIRVVELLGDVWSEDESGTPGTDMPSKVIARV